MQHTASPWFVDFSDVWLAYNDELLEQNQFAVEAIDLEVRKGEFIAIVGPSGCGKSTFMKLATGLKMPSMGKILIDQQPVTGPLKISGMAFQASSLLPWRTTVDNVLLPLEIVEPYRSSFKAKRKEYEERAPKLLQKVGLGGYEDKFPWQLSGGMQQRASICRALIHDPKMLLLDELFGALNLGRGKAPNFLPTIAFNPLGESFTFSPLVLHANVSLFNGTGWGSTTSSDTGWSNQITYTTPNFVGLKANIPYQFGEITTDTGKNNVGLNLLYAAVPPGLDRVLGTQRGDQPSASDTARGRHTHQLDAGWQLRCQGSQRLPHLWQIILRSGWCSQQSHHFSWLVGIAGQRQGAGRLGQHQGRCRRHP